MSDFDQDLYDRLMRLATVGLGEQAQVGYRLAATNAARIAAERQPVSDEELITAAELALEIINPHIIATRKVVPCELMERAISKALTALAPGPSVPVIPDGSFDMHFELDGVEEAEPFWSCWLNEDHRGTGQKWIDALIAAIAAAKDNDHD